MILRNFDNYVILSSLAFDGGDNNIIGDNSAFDDSHLCLKDINGALCKYSVWTSNVNYNNRPILSRFWWTTSQFSGITWSVGDGKTCELVAGSGITPVTYDDYKLENIFTSTQATKVNQTIGDIVYDQENKTWSRTLRLTCLAKTDLTVGEIGVHQCLWYTNSQTTTVPILVYRKTLEEPINVVANGNFIIEFTAIYSANPNKPADYTASVSVEE